MSDNDRKKIAHQIQTVLRKQHESGKRVRVDPEQIIEEVSDDDDGKWFYVPVDIAPYDNELGTFYELFSRAEEELEKYGIDVLLVPNRYETPAGNREERP